MYNVLAKIIIACICMILCACGGNNGSSYRAVESGIQYILPNGTIISSPTSTLDVNQGNDLNTSISIYGGTPGLSITFSDQVLESGSGLIISFNPATLISGSTTLSSTMLINATDAVIGSYSVELYASYSYGVINHKVLVGTMTINVNNGHTPTPGTLSISPQDPTINYLESAILTLSLNGREYDNNPLTVNLTSTNPWTITLLTNTCILTESSNTCPVYVYSALNGAGSSIIIASADGYESATTTMTVTNNSPVMYEWVSGESDTSIPHYGTKGIPSVDNTPGQRVWAVSWSDSSGNLWLFGGQGQDAYDNGGMLNDLWKYNPNDNTWTWVSGQNIINESGIYGVKGVASVNNLPGARDRSTYWSDESGNLWLFGGYGYDESGNLNDINDIWKYTIHDNTWTWVGGESHVGGIAHYGTKGVPSINNIPCARDTASGWYENNNLWLFGGEGFDNGYYNDLWKYNPNDNTWTWVSGPNESEQPANYGTKGVPSVNNIPGSRDSDVVWSDESGNLWLFGGFNSSGDAFNDLWKYSLNNNTWTWTSGKNGPWQHGDYGTKGVANESNVPGARWGGVVGWRDHQGNLWLFGGLIGSAHFNDVWRYNIESNLWTWMGGESTFNASGIYGTKGVPSSDNMIGYRSASVGWLDEAGNFWLFSGSGINDLWKIIPNGN